MTGCAMISGLDDFSHYEHDPQAEDIVRGHCVYRIPAHGYEQRKPIILLHELFGLSEDCAALARRLAGVGFAVHMPVLFGKPLPRTIFGGSSNALRMCVSREFTLLRTNKTSPVTAWVRSLAKEVSTQHEDSKVGIVGMCLTAHLVFPLTYEVEVGAVISSQSSMPWIHPGSARSRRESLAVGPEVLESIEGSQGRLAPVGALRFANDPISPPERMETICRRFGGAWIREVEDPIPRRRSSAFKPHSVLTGEYDDRPQKDTRRAWEEVIEFFQSNL